MPTTVKFRRGTKPQNDAFTGAAGEISIDMENMVLRVHDGATQGGHAIPKNDHVLDRIQVANANVLFADKMSVANTRNLVNSRLGATSEVIISGDATAQGYFNANTINLSTILANTGVTAGSYGSGSSVPVITIDSKGRITDATTTAVAGVTGVAFTGANNNLRVSTATGTTYDTTIDVSDKATWTALLATNTAIRSITSDLWSGLTATNTAIRALNTFTYDQLLATNTAIRALVTSNDNDIAALQLGLDNRMTVANTQALVDTRLGQDASITLGGDVSGSGSFSANAVSITVTVANDSHTHDGRYYTESETNTLLSSKMSVANTIALANSRLGSGASVTLNGDVSGSGTFSSNSVVIGVTVADDSHNHIIGNVDGLQAALDNRMTVANTQALVGDRLGATASVNLTGAVTGSASFSGNTISIATTATSDPTLTLSGDASGSATFTNLGNATLAVTVADDSHNHSSSTGNFTVGGDLTVTGGDISLSGTGRIQGVDTVTLDTDAANKLYVDASIAALSNSAPGTLDTLNRLAAALGDDPNFATTVVTNLSQKLGATASINLTGDVSGSGSFSSNTVSISVSVADDSHNHVISNVDGLQSALNNKMSVANTQALANSRLGAGASVALTGAVTGSASFSGNSVSISTTATSDPTLTLIGDVTGSATFTNLGNATLTAVVADDSHNHIVSNIDGLEEFIQDTIGTTLTGGGATTVSYNDTAATITISSTDTNTTYSAGGGIGLSGTTFSVDAGAGLSQTTTGLAMPSVISAGTYGSTADGTKIDTITVDAQGRVTAVSTGGTGSSSTTGTVTSVATGTGLTGGTITTSGTISLSHLGIQNLSDPNADRVMFWDDSTGAMQWLTMGSNLSISGTTLNATDTNTVYTHPTHPGDDINVDTGALTGATVISDLDFNITTDTNGHVTDANAAIATRNLTYSDVGAAAASHSHSYLPLSGGTVTGNLTVQGTFYETSDEKIKTDIQSITDALSKVGQLKGYTYVKNNEENRSTGVIAQEVQKVLPEAVTTGDDDNLVVAYGNMIGLLINAINELKAEVDELKKG